MVLLMIFVVVIMMSHDALLKVAHVTRYGPVNWCRGTVILWTLLHRLLLTPHLIYVASGLFQVDNSPWLRVWYGLVLGLMLLHVHLWPHHRLLVAVLLRMHELS